MTPTKWSSSIFPSFPRLFDDFFNRDLHDWSSNHFSNTNTTLPSVNIRENNDGFLVEMAAPGMKKEDFKLELDNEYLKISSEKQVTDEKQDDHRYTRREFSYQSFQRSFHLPKSVVDASKINARYENGMLQVLIPKREEAKALPPRRIEVA
jgi:HSP20 family protein